MILHRRSDAHWYSTEGTAQHTVIGASGEERSTTLRDARKLNLLPSVTSILSVISKPGLELWKQEQAILAALTLPRFADEDTDKFAARVVLDMEAQVEKASSFGTLVHAGIEDANSRGDTASFPAEIEKWMEHYNAWRRASLIRYIGSERVVVGDGYAGRYDLLAEHAEHGVCLIDFKTQNIKRGKPNFYDAWCCQLAAYRQAAGSNCHCLSVVIDSNLPSAPLEKLWTDQELGDGLDIFNCAKTIWRLQRGYYPSQAVV